MFSLFLNHIIDKIPNLVCIANRNGKVKSTNKEFRAKLRDVDNILNLIYEYDQVAYATIVKSLHDKKFEWTSNHYCKEYWI
jgi:glutamyl-tRNA reductase